jgi:uncharacterized membrane protein YhaH (DUF805 family)
MPSLIRYFLLGWQRSFDYSGRSSRPEYWWFYLANFLVGLFFTLLSAKSGLIQRLFFAYAVASIFPSLAIIIRRLRDAGKAWPWIFISLVPLIGGIWLIVLLCLPSLDPV